MIKVLHTPQQMIETRKALSGQVGFVPTMGALHQGHASLLRAARQNCEHLILSIFVNPTQFNDPKDLEKYPRTWEADLKIAEDCGVDYIFFPEFSSMYPDNYLFKLSEAELSLKFCGASRPGHFDGVLTVVLKLLNIVQPHRAYFGEKDYQQYLLIKGMTEALFLDCEIVPMPIVRESDGLAMSSRNIRLTNFERELAPKFYHILSTSSSADVAKAALTHAGFKVDYVEDWQGRRLGAVFLGSVRLIDNVKI